MRRGWRVGGGVAAACAMLLLTACGDESQAAVATPAAVTVPEPATTVPSTSAAPTTTSSTVAPTTISSTTTTSTTSTTVAATLPNPEAPPPENANEPLAALGTIEIPRINVTKTIYEGITLSTLDHGPGHWPGTAMPGQPGNMVIAGHRVSHDKPFRNLDKLQAGDDVIVTTDAGRFVYKVTSTEVVAPDALWIVDQTADATGTLFACHPPGSTRQRIVVHLVFDASA